MKINIHSITFKTLAHLIIFSILFILFITLSSKEIFSNAYLGLEKDKISIIENNISPSIALNISYDFFQAVEEIAQTTLQNPNVLLLEIELHNNKKKLSYSKHKYTIGEYLEKKEIISTINLKDPATQTDIATLTLVYSNSSYKNYMKKFYNLFFWGILGFSLSLILLAYLLFNSLKNLRVLAKSLKDFDPHNPKELHIPNKYKDEIASITTSANSMVHKLIQFLEDSEELNLKLTQNQAHLKDAQRIAHVGSWEYNIDNKKLSLSDEVYRILGIKRDSNMNWDIFLSLISKKDREFVLRVINNAIINGSYFDLKYEVITKLKTINVHTRGKVRKKVDGQSKITAVSMDISSEIQNKQMIEKLAYYDSLTNLPNRTLLKDRANKALQNAQRYNTKLAVIFLDLDHFKLINDTLGHSMGDKLLIYVSQLLKKQIRESDTLARIGGDEFVILLPLINAVSDVENIANKILNVFKGKHIIDSHQLYITTSIGIAVYPDSSSNMDELITNADTAMYDAKQDGRNNYKIYLKSMGNHISTQMRIEQDLKDAIKNRNGLEVFYQVKIDAYTNKISGAEALIRWNHPELGLIFPDDFIPIAESTGMILDMGNWIIEQSISQLKEWNQMGYSDLKIAINLSPRQFQDNDLVPFIYKMIEKYKISPHLLEFEITETMSMSNMESTMRVLNELKNIGVGIAIDDFGTGYSSLAYLKKFPINTLKIDKSFVMDMIGDEGDKVIVQTIISMAHSLGFKTVAEGVESETHVQILKNMDCDQLQGYNYSKAIPKEKFTQFLQNYSPNK